MLHYCDEAGEVSDATNPNGAQRNIAGICDESGRILVLIPHPERLFELALGSRSRFGDFHYRGVLPKAR